MSSRRNQEPKKRKVNKKVIQRWRSIFGSWMSKNKKTNSDQTIERLVEFKIKRNSISLTRKKPINLILEEGNSRNWEAIVRFGESGFLIATDKYPRMILAYVKL